MIRSTPAQYRPIWFYPQFLASLVALHFTPVSHTLGGSFFLTSIALRLASFSEPDTFIHQTFPGMPDHYGVHILEVYVYRLVPMRGPTIKRPSGPRREHHQHLRQIIQVSPWIGGIPADKTELVLLMVAIF